MKHRLNLMFAVAAVLATGSVYAAAWPKNFSKCADQGKICNVGITPKLVTFGSHDKWTMRTLRGKVSCTPQTFGVTASGREGWKCAIYRGPRPGSLSTPVTPRNPAKPGQIAGSVAPVKPGAATAAPIGSKPVQPVAPSKPAQHEAPVASGTFNASIPAIAPLGFAASVTGGKGGEVVHPKTPDELKRALCNDPNATTECNDAAPRIIVLDSVIDFTGTEPEGDKGYGYIKACKLSTCSNPESFLMLLPAFEDHCKGQEHFTAKYDIAGVKMMPVGSNKTLVGASPKAGIKGKGLILQGVNNVSISNISFTDINQGLVFGGDAIRINGVNRLSIDHNYFSRIARAFISSSPDKSEDVTISWNEFDGNNTYSPLCDGHHYWGLLLQAPGNMTFAYNWIHHTSGRSPKILGDVFVQAVDNVFENDSGHALNAVGSKTRVLLEGNTFENVTTPIQRDAAHDPGFVFGLRNKGQQTAATIQQCMTTIGRECAPNSVNPIPSSDAFTSDSIVLSGASAFRTRLLKPGITASRVRAYAGAGKL